MRVVRTNEEQRLRNSVLDGKVEMDSNHPEDGELYLESGFWKLRLHDVAGGSDTSVLTSRPKERSDQEPIWVGMATGPKGLTKKEAREMVHAILLSQLRHRQIVQQSSMTVAEFVERKFVPEYVAFKGLFGRMHYQSMLKHVVNPEEIDRLFGVDMARKKPRLRPVKDWPYLGHVPLRDVRPASVQNLTSVALSRGYSTQTVAHIRNVVSTIFSHATREMCFSGENPARPVQLPKVNRKQMPSLTRAEMVRVMGVMDYPEKEMTLIAILTGMTIAEICALRWKRVNLSEEEMLAPDNEIVPLRTVIVREEWVRGQLIEVADKRKVNCKIPGPLLPVLRRLKRRGAFIGADDFVLVSRVGSPINPSNVLTRKLKPIGKEMQIPWLSWQNLRRIHKSLLTEFGIAFPDQMAWLLDAMSPRGFKEEENWRSVAETELPY